MLKVQKNEGRLTIYSRSKEMPRLMCAHEGCKKKMTLVDYACKCSKLYCCAHRIPEVHNCTFDYKEEQKKNLLVHMGSPVISKKIEIL